MLMAICLVYSTFGITSDKKVFRELKIVALLNILKYQTQIQFDLRYEKIVPNYAKKYFHESDISPSIFELERRSIAQNVGNAHGYPSGPFNFRYNFR